MTRPTPDVYRLGSLSPDDLRLIAEGLTFKYEALGDEMKNQALPERDRRALRSRRARCQSLVARLAETLRQAESNREFREREHQAAVANRSAR